MADTFLQSRIPVIEAQIIAYDDAILAFGNSNIQSYTLDTGQDRQVVTRGDIASMKNMRNSLYNSYVTLKARCGSPSGTIIARPSW